MTKKDFQLIADVLKAATIHNDTDAQVVRHLAHDFAARLAQENDRFDSARFLKACAVGK